MMLEPSTSAGSQAAQPHLEDGTTYRPLRPTNVHGRQNRLRVVAGDSVNLRRPSAHSQLCIEREERKERSPLTLLLRLGPRQTVTGKAYREDEVVLSALSPAQDVGRGRTPRLRSALKQIVVLYGPTFAENSNGTGFRFRSPGLDCLRGLTGIF